MMDAICWYLKSDDELKGLLGITNENPKIYPFEHADDKDVPYIVYSYSPFLSGEVTTQYRVELRVVSNTLSVAQSIEKAIMRLMHFRRKNGFIHNGWTIFNSSHIGGGMLKNSSTNKYEQFIIFNVIAKGD